MMIGIFGRQILVGDTILTGGGHQGKVLEYLYSDSGGLHFKLDIGHLCFLSGTIVGLLHRPCVDEKTEFGLLDVVAECAQAFLDRRSFSKQDEEITADALFKAAVANHLGKSFDVAQDEPLEEAPSRNQSLRDRHMCP